MMKARVVFFAILMLAGPAYRPARGCQAMFDGPSDGHNFGKGDKIVVHTRIEGFAVTSGIDHVGSGGQLRGGHGKLFVNGISVFDTLTAHKASISLGPSLDPLAKSHTVVLQAFRSGEARPCHSASISFATEAALPDRMADVCIFARSCVSYRDLWSTMPPLPRMERENEQDLDDLEPWEPFAEDDIAWERGGHARWTSPRPPNGLAALREVHSMAKRRRHESSEYATSSGGTDSIPDFSHFLRAEGGELVIMDDFGPGCVYRIFVPSLICRGEHDRSAEWSLRVRIDGDLAVDISMRDWADVGTPPFIHPLAGHGGLVHGWFSLVPMVFHARCTISLVPIPGLDADAVIEDSQRCLKDGSECLCKAYWNVDYRKGSIYSTSPPYWTNVTRELVSALKLLAGSGGDWVYGHFVSPEATHKHAAMAVVRGPSVLWEREGSGCILRLKFWSLGSGQGLRNLRLLVWFDGEGHAQVNVPMVYLFNWNDHTIVEEGHSSRGLYVGHTALGEGYITMPMPYWDSVRIAVVSDGEETIHLGYEVVFIETPPCETRGNCGTLHATFESNEEVAEDEDYVFFDAKDRWGMIVGIVTDIRPGELLEDTLFYEGDFKVWVDGALSPKQDGTGTEDFFLGSHGFNEFSNFSEALFGAPFIRTTQPNGAGSVVWHNYRLMHGGDAILFNAGVRAVLEHGSTHAPTLPGVGGEQPHEPASVKLMRNKNRSNKSRGKWTSLVIAYLGPQGSAMSKLVDEVDVGDAESEAAHGYRVIVGGEGCGREGWRGWVAGGGVDVRRVEAGAGCRRSEGTVGGRGDCAGESGEEIEVKNTGEILPVWTGGGEGRGVGAAVEFGVGFGGRDGDTLLLRRTMSHTRPDQCARVCVDEAYAGSWLTGGAHSYSKEKESEFVVPPRMLVDDRGRPKKSVVVRLEVSVCVGTGADTLWWTSSRYQAFALS